MVRLKTARLIVFSRFFLYNGKGLNIEGVANMKRWFEQSVVYQIYPLSFYDSNGDGIGDIPGIIEKLDYIQTLGADVIWLSPVYASPMDDNGYDISDYYAIHPLFGTMDDFKRLLAEAHKRGIKIIMDLVVNHTSDEHVWFKEALKGKDNPYRDYYIWRKPAPDGGVPNNIRSVFSGPAWEYDESSGEYYFHMFSKRQPDLNWQNPKLREAIYQMINWWLDLGIDGFRLDVIDHIGKDVDKKQIVDGPYLYDYLEEMYEKCFRGRDILTVGETPGSTVEMAKRLTAKDRPILSMIFNFQHIGLDEVPGQGKWALKPLDLRDLKRVFNSWQQGLHGVGWNSLYWSNHDQPRIISRWGDDSTEERRVLSGKMLATILHLMEGTPYIYQGEEIGMTNVRFTDLSDYRDIETLNMYQEKREQGWSHNQIMASIYAKGRDNARTPMQWDDSPQAGFTTGTPWIKVNPNYKRINVKQALSDPDSLFYYYQKLIRLRKQERLIQVGSFELLEPDHPQLFMYRRHLGREHLLVVANFYGDPLEVMIEERDYELLIANYEDVTIQPKLTLRPFETIVLKYVDE